MKSTPAFEQRYELAEAFIKLPYEEMIETDAVVKQRGEGGAIHHGQACVAQGNHIIRPGFILEHAAFAERLTRGRCDKARNLAATRHYAQPGEAGDYTGPVIELIAASENDFVRAVRFSPLSRRARPRISGSLTTARDQAAMRLR